MPEDKEKLLTPECYEYLKAESLPFADFNHWGGNGGAMNEENEIMEGWQTLYPNITAYEFALFTVTLSYCRFATNEALPKLWKACQETHADCGPDNIDNRNKATQLRNHYFKTVWEYCPRLVDSFKELWEEGYTAVFNTRGLTEVYVSPYTDAEGRQRTKSSTTIYPTEMIGPNVTITAPPRTSLATSYLAFTTAFASGPSVETAKPSAGSSVRIGRREVCGISAALLVGIVGIGML